MKIQEVEELFAEIFQTEDGMVKTLSSVYEKGKDELKLVISIHGLSTSDNMIIHTKFIFRVDEQRINISKKFFTYLYNINCIYHKKEFSDLDDLRLQIESIVKTNNFGNDIKLLSDFIDAPAMFLNEYFQLNNIEEYSVFNVNYEPKFKTQPCESTTFDFNININGNYDLEVSIYKIDKNTLDEGNEDMYKIQYSFLDEIVTLDYKSLKNVHALIGAGIIQLMDRKLKNK